MGEEIPTSHFSSQDFEDFTNRLRDETFLLKDWFARDKFAKGHEVGGFELEAWLVDSEAHPAPINKPFLELLNSPSVVLELSRFNVELHTPPQVLRADALSCMQRELESTWQSSNEAASAFDAKLAMIGILPTVREEDLSLSNMSDLERYRALNEQVFRMRHGHPLRLDIQGRERLQTEHRNVMLESATTSFQIHLQVDAASAVRYYNAAQIVSAPMVAASANSPYLFGKDLWDETRITLFEQSINTCDERDIAHCPPARVTFGDAYIKESLLELYTENLGRFPVLLPCRFDDPKALLHHLRLHNGTIWRWNRPLIGFGDNGTVCLRIEHRVVPAGPSAGDSIANAALFYGLVHALSKLEVSPESQFEFGDARENFYTAARHGLTAELKWLQGFRGSAQVLLLEELIPMARRGLLALGLDKDEADDYLDIIDRRVRTGRNGAAWLRAYRARHECTMQELTTVYLEHQNLGKPVHEWVI